MSPLAYLIKHANLLTSQGANPHRQLIIDILEANAPVAKKYWPEANQNNFYDDTVSLVKEVLTPTRVPTAEELATASDAVT